MKSPAPRVAPPVLVNRLACFAFTLGLASLATSCNNNQTFTTAPQPAAPVSNNRAATPATAPIAAASPAPAPSVAPSLVAAIPSAPPAPEEILPAPAAPAAPLKPTDLTEEAKLPFVPYSSSYLPYKDGPLTHTPGNGPTGDDSADVAAWMRLRESRATVGERFDELRSLVLGKTDKLSTYFSTRMYNDKAEDWEGFCNQWSAASLDPTLAKMLASTDDLACKGVYLSKGEIQELLTAFDPAYSVGGLIGDRTDKELDKNVVTARENTGRDPLPAHVFHHTVYQNLNQGRGLVGSMHAPGQIWNYPIYDAKTKYMLLNELTLMTVDAPMLAPYLIQVKSGLNAAETTKATALLKAYSDTYAALARFTPTAGQNPNDAPLSKAAFDSAKAAGVSRLDFISLSDLDTLVSLKKDIYTKVLAMGRTGQLTLTPGYTIQFAQTTLSYAVEVGFASGQDVQTTRDLNYLLIFKGEDKDASDSQWVADVESRPQFLWIPNSPADPRNAANPFAKVTGLGDLYAILNQCSGHTVDAAEQFMQLLRAATADRVVSPGERAQLIAAFGPVRTIVDLHVVAQVLNGSTGLTISELIHAVDLLPAAGSAGSRTTSPAPAPTPSTSPATGSAAANRSWWPF